MRQHPHEEGVIQFLLRSFVDGERRFNVPVLWDQYPRIVGWETIPTWEYPALFIPGGNPPYVTETYREQLLAQFPQARAHVVAGAGHWVHAEKPEAVLRAICRYLDEQVSWLKTQRLRAITRMGVGVSPLLMYYGVLSIRADAWLIVSPRSPRSWPKNKRTVRH